MPFFPTTHFLRHHLAQLLRAACIACLCHWLPSLSLRRLASARVVTGSRRWLARVVAGLLRWRRWLSRWCSSSALIARSFGLVSLRSALRPWLALLARCSRCWLPLLGLHQLTSAPIAWLALLCSHCEPSVTRLCSTRVAGSHRSALFGLHRWLARVIAGLRCWHRWLSHWRALLAHVAGSLLSSRSSAQQKGSTKRIRVLWC